MGRPKLLLPWPADQPRSAESLLDKPLVEEQTTDGSTGRSAHCFTVMDRVLQAWTTSRVTETVVVVRSDDSALIEVCSRWPVTLVRPDHATADMKASICVGLQSLMARGVPTRETSCFIAPADLPGLTAQVIDGLIDAQSKVRSILLPRFGHSLDDSVSGHPALLPWKRTAEIFALGPQEGVDTVIKRHRPEFILFPPELAVFDIDTPAEYLAALENLHRSNRRFH